MNQTDYHSSIAVSFKKVTKIYHQELKVTRLKEILTGIFKKKSQVDKKVYKFDSVSFDIFKGECVGIIGKNGSGKSTALGMIAGITTPTSGEIHINGKVTTMLELGSGFHPDFSGKENIFLNGSLFGMSNYYLTQKINEIVEFSELGNKIYEPIRTYSAGMKARLAFSIAIQTQPEILLIDEVLAVGDIAFQKKCLQKFEEIKKEKETTIIYVTHSMEQVTQHCSRAIWLHNGKLMGDGPPKEISDEYQMFTAP
ncbi:MAG: ABC transporter ATP-binding protein [Candidatus Caenarcaniphilales bacterium]|nr:ABC transporter ATP-binding protein [Candidatus Caenarcaniphilales bacterium]